MVTSGTAALETALFNVRQAGVDKANEASYQSAKRSINLKYISLVNLSMDEPIVTELIQSERNTANIKTELDELSNKNYRDEMFVKYRELREKLGGGGASERVVNSLRSF